MHIASKKDFWSAIIILVIMAVCWQESHNIDTTLNFSLGPLFFPRILMGALVVSALILLIRSIGFSSAPASGESGVKLDYSAIFWRTLLLCLTILYVLALPYAGYTGCTLVFLFVTMCCLGKRKPLNLAIYASIAAAMTFGLYWIFSGLLHLFLP